MYTSFGVYIRRLGSYAHRWNRSHKVDIQLILQLTASIIASVCSAASLGIWLLSITHGHALKLVFSKKPIIPSQALIGAVIFFGSLCSPFLALHQRNAKSGKKFNLLPFRQHKKIDPFSVLFQSIMELEIGSLLILLTLNEVPNWMGLLKAKPS